MDPPIVELPRSFCEGIECRRRPQEDTLQPDREGFDGFGRCTGLSVDLDDVGSVSGTVIFGETRHCALLQLFDPFDFSLKTVANVDSEPRVLGVENVPLWATFEGVGVSLDEILEPIDPTVKLPYFGHVIVFSLLNCFEQRFGNALQGIGIEVGAAIKNVSG